MAATLANRDRDELEPCLLDIYKPTCIIGTYVISATDATSDGLTFAGYGSICEGCSLVIMLVSFLAAGVLCIRRFFKGATNLISEVGRKNSKVRLHIIVTVSTVFVTFLMRSLYAAALAASRRDSRIATPFADNPQCAQTTYVFCDPCQGLGIIVQSWLWLCPAFSFTVFLLSSIVTILVSLWGMTPDHILQRWTTEFRWKSSLRVVSMKPFIKAGGDT